MGYFLFTIGFLGLTVFGIWLIINLIIKKPIKKIGIALIASFLAFCIGIAIVPVDSDAGSAPREQNEDVLPGEDEVGDIENPIQEDQDGSQPSKSEKKEEDIPPSATAPSGQLKVHFIDVGQGDAILIQTPKQNVLIDGGPKNSWHNSRQLFKKIGNNKTGYRYKLRIPTRII